VRLQTLLEILSDFHQIHALLSRIDLLDERLQVTGAEHFDDNRNLLIFWKFVALGMYCWCVELDLW
jgi:hypothetical protein